MVHLLAHGMSTPAETWSTVGMLALLAVGIVGGSVLGVATRHGGPRSVKKKAPSRESLEAWSGGSWERY